MHPRIVYIIMIAWLAVMVGMGHYNNASQIGSIKWFGGVVSGLVFCGAYFALKSKLLNIILTVIGLALLLAGALDKFHISDSSNRIFLSAFVFGSLVVMAWQGFRVHMLIRNKRIS